MNAVLDQHQIRALAPSPAPRPRPAPPRAAVTVAHGDGIGPEIMRAVLDILDAAGARLDLETIEVGEAVYRRGHASGITPDAWQSLRRTRVLLKAPITTPQGGGFKSLNVTLRKKLGLYANLRPCVAYAPFVETRHPGMDVVIVRENEEDLYAGIEHRQTRDVVQCLKLITRPGCERIIRYAFEHARAHGRRKVSCFTKDNIMKATDGLFHRVFDEIAAEYPDLQNEHWIVDIGAARLADAPELFDVVVMPNLYGDILSDVAAEIAGSVGLAGSANLGDHCAMFEAIHGSAPRRAGQDLANPSGLLLGAVMMLVHVRQPEVATRVHNAWLRTLEEGIHTYDIFREERSRRKVGTQAFARAVIERLGQVPQHLPATHYGEIVEEPGRSRSLLRPRSPERKELAGIDVFLDFPGIRPERLAERVKAAVGEAWALQMITNRGVSVWPNGFEETFCVDHWRCRFGRADGARPTHPEIVGLLGSLAGAGLDFIKTEHLYDFDGVPGYSLGQGQ